jgi:hypothetical protein
MTRRERLERKLEKREQWAESRHADTDRRFGAAKAQVEHIPMGQPILVGHHSEGRHRAALRRHDSNMRAAIESDQMAKHHESKAAGLAAQLESTVYSDDPDAIEQLEAKIAEAEQEQARYKQINAILRKSPKYKKTADKIAALVSLGMSEALADRVFETDCMGNIGIPSYKLSNNNANIRRMRERISQIKRRQQLQQQAEENGGTTIVRSGEWCSVVFAEKPDRSILQSLKAAGFYWGSGKWSGKFDALPPAVVEMTDSAAQ